MLTSYCCSSPALAHRTAASPCPSRPVWRTLGTPIEDRSGRGSYAVGKGSYAVETELLRKSCYTKKCLNAVGKGSYAVGKGSYTFRKGLLRSLRYLMVGEDEEGVLRQVEWLCLKTRVRTGAANVREWALWNGVVATMHVFVFLVFGILPLDTIVISY